ncbi:PspC domain-containing protein [Solihabitans fulvus]|uniref:PspC domain-containing protein n=1 Tax=Solihabitans fulvus TaxID=1892852 RepID=UPI001CB767E2|nr:PspC domain-containing protein [Solihabitans fulvus]
MSGRDGSQSSVEDTLKDFWSTRPRRQRQGRKVAGVAAGIARRYGIDPVIVRVALVVSAFYGGIGIVLYLLGWLFLADEDDEVSPFESMINKGRSSTSTGFTVLLCIALIPATSYLFHGGFGGDFGTLMTVLLVCAGAYVLHRSRGHLFRPTPTESSAPSAAGAPAASTAATAATASASSGVDAPVDSRPADDAPTTPPAWDPLGAAPFAWDLPEPSAPPTQQEPPPPPRRKSKVGPATVGISLLAVAGMLVASAAGGDWLTGRHMVGVVLAILGLGMVGGSFVRGGRGLFWLALPLSVVGIALTSSTVEHWNGAGELRAAPTTVAGVAPRYEQSLGDIQLDLTGLTGTGTVHTKVDVGVGKAMVQVPTNAAVEVHCSTGFGAVDCLDHQSNGSDLRANVTEPGSGGLKIELDVHAGSGDVEVRRG